MKTHEIKLNERELDVLLCALEDAEIKATQELKTTSNLDALERWRNAYRTMFNKLEEIQRNV